jgi:hypothetical protein
MRFVSLLSLMLFVPLLQAQPVNSFTIDNFNTANGTAADSTLDGQGSWTGLNPGPSVLGSYRVLGNYLVAADTGNPPGPFFSSTKIGSSVFSISNQADTRSVGQVIWQGSDATPNTDAIIAHPAAFNLGNLNFNSLLSSPDFNFQWSVINADGRNWSYTIRAYTDDASNYFEGVVVSDQSGLVLSIPKASFGTVGSPSWSNVDAVSFSATYTDGLLGGDLAVDYVQLAVPEPGAYLLIGVTAAVVGGYYYLKRRKLAVAA